MRKVFLSLAIVLCVLCVFSAPEALAKSKKSKKKASQPHMNGVEAIIRGQQSGEAVEIVDPDNPKKRITVEAPKAEKTEEKANKDEEKEQAKEPSNETPEAPPAPPIIVIDPGHGGKDPGASGAFGKGKKAFTVREKDIVLQISKHLEAALKKKLKAKVYYTRPNDTFITLGERNRIANRRHGDLFISIHANAAKNPSAKGIEIYSLNKATDEASRRLAARENEGAPQEEHDMEAILSDLEQTSAAEESAVLAADVEKSFSRKLKQKYGIERLEKKTALFYVLVGAKCPGLLIETGFVTNPAEGKRLKTPAYQKDMANAIADAVAAYLAKADQATGDL